MINERAKKKRELCFVDKLQFTLGKVKSWSVCWYACGSSILAKVENNLAS